jgi:hypothetical protein
MRNNMKPKNTARSILEELNSMHNDRNINSVVKNRATNIIESAINLINLMYEKYPESDAIDLERRLINSIRGQDSKKFDRGIKKINEGKK